MSMPGKMPAELPPMETRSLPRVERATVQPSLGVPTTSSSGTKTSLKNTSLKSALPVIWRNGRTSTPGPCMSITMVVMPACLGASGSVRTVANPRWQYWAPEVQTFWPLTSQPPSTRTPLVLTAAASDPASGSLKSWHQTNSPISVRSTQRSTWSGVAYWLTVMMFQPVMPKAGGRTPTALSSSSMMSCSIAPASRPPGCGPVRDHETRADEGLALLVPAEGGQPLGFEAQLGPHLLGLGRQVKRHLTGRPLRRQAR